MLLWLFYLVKDINVSHIPSGYILVIILLPLTWMQLILHACTKQFSIHHGYIFLPPTPSPSFRLGGWAGFAMVL